MPTYFNDRVSKIPAVEKMGPLVEPVFLFAWLPHNFALKTNLFLTIRRSLDEGG